MAESKKRNKKLKEKFEGKGKTPNRLSKNPISDRRIAIQRLAPASGKKGATMTQKEYEKAIIDQENYNLGYSQGLKEQKNYMSPTSKFFRKAGGMGLYRDDNRMRAMPGLSEGDPKQKNLSPSRQGRLQARYDVSKTIKKKAGGALKAPANPGLKKLPTKVRNKMGYMKSGGKVGYSKGGIVDRQYLKGR